MAESHSGTRGLFITGTDTGVGKTYVAAMIVREATAAGLTAGAYKPCCSGAVVGPEGEPGWDDVDVLADALGRPVDRSRICPQRFRAPLAPPVAARQEGTTVDSDLLRAGARWWRDRVELLIVEGVGGLLCPLTEEETVADLAADLGYPLIIVARSGLGTVNHTLLTVEAARHRGLAVAGVVLNEVSPDPSDESVETNSSEIARRGDVPVLGLLGHGESCGLLRDAGRIRVDWQSLAGQCVWGVEK